MQHIRSTKTGGRKGTGNNLILEISLLQAQSLEGDKSVELILQFIQQAMPRAISASHSYLGIFDLVICPKGGSTG